jgi:hypothetical protein
MFFICVFVKRVKRAKRRKTQTVDFLGRINDQLASLTPEGTGVPLCFKGEAYKKERKQKKGKVAARPSPVVETLFPIIETLYSREMESDEHCREYAGDLGCKGIFILATHYCMRINQTHGVAKENTYLLFAVAILLAQKVLDDTPVNNVDWARATNIRRIWLNSAEHQVLGMLGYRMNLSEEEAGLLLKKFNLTQLK